MIATTAATITVMIIAIPTAMENNPKNTILSDPRELEAVVIRTRINSDEGGRKGKETKRGRKQRKRERIQLK
jgi:hypothetical protein